MFNQCSFTFQGEVEEVSTAMDEVVHTLVARMETVAKGEEGSYKEV
jgi:hypothetical protein